jgi:hypothetical protein
MLRLGAVWENDDSVEMMDNCSRKSVMAASRSVAAAVRTSWASRFGVATTTMINSGPRPKYGGRQGTPDLISVHSVSVGIDVNDFDESYVYGSRAAFRTKGYNTFPQTP